MDDLSKRLTAANPYGRSLEYGRFARTFAEVTKQGAPSETVRHPSRRARWVRVSIGAIAFAFALVSVLVVVTIVRPGPAWAVTPRPLQITPSNLTPEVLLRELANSSPTEDSSTRTVRSSGWYALLDGEEVKQPTVIQPQVTTLHWNEDLSGSILMVAGEVYSPETGAPAVIPPDAVEPGTVLWEQTWGPGEYSTLLPGVPPVSAADMRTYLADYYMVPESEMTASMITNAVLVLLQTWTPGEAASRALLEVLLTTDGVVVLGETVDRAGRPGVVLAIQADDGALHSDQVIFSLDDWRILAHERTAPAGIPEFGIPAGAVTEYTTWGETR